MELNDIVLKEEPGFFLKEEDEEQPCVRKVIKRTARCKKCPSKDDRIASLQSDLNKRNGPCAKCLKNDDRITSLQSELSKRNGPCAKCLKNDDRITSLQAELSKRNGPCGKCSEKDAKIASLTSELTMRATQCKKCSEKDHYIANLQSELNKIRSEITKVKVKSVEKDKEYIVEAIIGHKVRKGQQFFHVHWKGYSQQENTWERRDNLIGNTAFNQYLKIHNLK